MISLGNQQHAIIAHVSPVRDTMKSYFCFLTFCTLQSHHCRTLLYFLTMGVKFKLCCATKNWSVPACVYMPFSLLSLSSLRFMTCLSIPFDLS